MNTHGCISDRELFFFSHNLLSNVKQGKLLKHLNECEACRQKVATTERTKALLQATLVQDMPVRVGQQAHRAVPQLVRLKPLLIVVGFVMLTAVAIALWANSVNNEPTSVSPTSRKMKSMIPVTQSKDGTVIKKSMTDDCEGQPK